MATLFRATTYSVSGLVEDIRRGDLALPDIQRPFVWQPAKVRDLLDSMYKGFPVGYLLFWEVGAEAGARQIGDDDKERAPRLLIVDGQQRLTSLYAVMTGTEIVREYYTHGRIRIAFRPADGTFAVADAAVAKDPEFLPDISRLWAPGERWNQERAFLDHLAQKRPLSDHERDRLREAISHVHDLQNYPLAAVELAASVEEEQVAEVFVRINSEGVTLNQADFILTLMSVFWEKGRRELEDFCRTSKAPTLSQASPFNWYLRPQPPQLLRVGVALAFRRAVLKHVYTMLRGRDVETGRSDPQRREAQFVRLQGAQEKVLDLTNWHEFLYCLERAGFRGAKMISSDNAVLFSYAMWLIGRVDHRVPLDQLREVIARWFFMAHTTSRYTGTFETRFEQDVARLADLPPGDASGFIDRLSTVIDDVLTSDYWTITLPNELATSAAKSPALLAYIAALNILDADALLSTGKIRSRLDPAITEKKGIERHHLFPRAYLRATLKITESRDINQIANMALVEWADNIAISDDAPADYWPAQIDAKRIPAGRLAKQMYWHALPDGWQDLDYRTFLTQRRRLMALVVRDAYTLLRDATYAPQYPPPSSAGEGERPKRTWTSHRVRISDLIDADLLPAGTILRPAKPDIDAEVIVLPNGKLAYGDEIFDSPSGVSDAIAEASTNGWYFWTADTPDGTFTLAALREKYKQLGG